MEGRPMTWKKRVAKELIWFICTLVAGTILCLLFYDILDVDLNRVIIVVGVIAAVMAIYVVRLTLWVLKQSMK